MQPDLALRSATHQSHFGHALAGLAAAWSCLFLLTIVEWREMAHQWWNIDTYNHVLLVPLIIVWLAWMRRAEAARAGPQSWLGGLVWLGAALATWLVGRWSGINLLSHIGTIGAFQGAVIAVLGVRLSLVLALPILFAAFMVPFGDELIPLLQHITARMTVGLVHVSGVPAVIDGLFIDTPAGRFVVAEECSGVKFLIAMTALATLVSWTSFATWRKRVILIAGAAVVSILANGVRAWGTIFAAQYVGAERAAGIDHIVYGWFFFAFVIVLVLGVAWRFFDRDPEDAGFSAEQAAAHPIATLQTGTAPVPAVVAAAAMMTAAFAVLGTVV